MPETSDYLAPVVSFAGALASMCAVAAVCRMVVKALFDPSEKRRELIDRYGRWAVELAEASCPRGDEECVEREARRLYEVRIARLGR